MKEQVSMFFDERFDITLECAILANTPVMLVGEPGIGKSSHIEWLDNTIEKNANEHRKFGVFQRLGRCKTFVLQCNTLAGKDDVTAQRQVKDTHGNWQLMTYPRYEISQANTYAQRHPDEHVLLSLDEFNRAPTDIVTTIMSLITARRIGNVKLADNLILIGTGNDHGDITPLDSAQVSRFSQIIMQPDVKTYLKFQGDICHSAVRQALEEDNSRIYQTENEDLPSMNPHVTDYDDAAELMRQTTCPRTLSALSRFLTQLGTDNMQYFRSTPSTLKGPRNLLEENVYGYIGRTEAACAILENLANQLDGATRVKQPRTPANYRKLREKLPMSILNLKAEMHAWTPAARTNTLVYVLTDQTTDAMILKALLECVEEHMEGLTNTQVEKIRNLAGARLIATKHIGTLRDSNTNVANTILAAIPN